MYPDANPDNPAPLPFYDDEAEMMERPAAEVGCDCTDDCDEDECPCEAECSGLCSCDCPEDE